MLATDKVSEHGFGAFPVRQNSRTSRLCQRRNPQDSGPLPGCPLGNLVSISANMLTLALVLLCWLHKNRMFGQTADEERLKDTSRRLVRLTN